MSGESKTTTPAVILDKRVAIHSSISDQYLIERTIDDISSQQWVTVDDIADDCRQLIANYNHTMKTRTATNGNVANGDDRPSSQTVTNGHTNGQLESLADKVVAKCDGEEVAVNGFDRGYRPFKILGAKEDNGLKFLVMFREDLTKADLVPNHVLHQKCPQLLIKYYEKNTLWKRH